MIICIGGMHRSGTSMIARMLNICGVYLGEEKDLIPAASDNPEGFWEHAGFRAINEGILGSYGGNWDYPPALESGWEKKPHLNLFTERTNEVLSQFQGHPIWGWKDPQNSLTLPYWKSMLPGLKVVVCMRNPYDIYQSLARRGYSSSRFSYQLWLTYFNYLTATLPENYIVTHFESYFHDAYAEIQRVTSLLEINVSDEKIKEAAGTIKAGLVHSHGTISNLQETEAPKELIDIYNEFCKKSGPVFSKSQNEAEKDLLDGLLVSARVDDEASKIISALRFEIKQKNRDIDLLDQSIRDLKHELKEKNEELENIYNSRGWKLLEKIRGIAGGIRKDSA